MLCTNWLPFEINTIEHHNKQQYPIDKKHDFPPHFVDIWIINELRIFCLIHWLTSSVKVYREIITTYQQRRIFKIYNTSIYNSIYFPIKMWKTIRKISLGCNWIFGFWINNKHSINCFHQIIYRIDEKKQKILNRKNWFRLWLNLCNLPFCISVKFNYLGYLML